MQGAIVTLEPDGKKWRTRAGNGLVTAAGQRKTAVEQDEPSYADPEGKVWYPYLAEFRSADGGRFCVEVWATDDTHAEQQVKALRETAAVQGRIVASGLL